MTKDEILKTIEEMSATEVGELVKAIEDRFHVCATVAVAPAPVEPEQSKEEQVEFTVVLVSFGEGKKIPVIKEIRAITGIGLKDSKDLVEAIPKPVVENADKARAEEVKKKLEAAGAVVELK